MRLSKSYTIRKYTIADKEKLIILFNELQDYHIQLDPIDMTRRLKGYGIETLNKTIANVKKSAGIFLVAENEGHIVGFIAGTISQPVAANIKGTTPSRAGKVNELYVEAAVRNQGVASLLMGKVEEYFIKNKCKYVWIDLFAPNIPAHSLYSKHGYSNRNIEMIKTLNTSL